MRSGGHVRGSLRTRFTLALFGVGVLPLVALGLLTQPILHRGLSHAERLLQSTSLDHVDTLLEDALDRAADATHQVGTQLFAAGPGVDAQLELARERMARVPELRAIHVYKPSGEWVDSLSRDARRALRSLDPAHLDCEAEAAGTWTVAAPVGDGDPRLEYREPVFDARGGCVAWLVAAMDAAVLDERLRGVSRSVFERADAIFVIDDAHHVVAPRPSPEARRDLEALRDHLPGALAQISGTLTTEFVGPDGTPIVASVRHVVARGWNLAVRRDQRVAYASIAGVRRALFLAAFVLGGVALVVGAVLARRTTRPVEALVRLTQAYGRREFEARPAVHSGDELETLGEAMATMASGLQASEREIARRAVVEDSLARYVPKELAASIAAGEASLELGGRRRKITVLFADVASFTPFAEAAPPEKTIALLNELFTIASEVVFRHGGTVDKFIGDSVMALFGALSDEPEHARRALAAAQDLQRFVAAMGATWWDSYGVRIELAIGIATGEAIVGNLGSTTRMEFTAIGDIVNTAARLETLARPGQTLATREVTDAAGEGYAFASLGAHPLRGKQAPLEIYELR